jgi:hypothetical protein
MQALCQWRWLELGDYRFRFGEAAACTTWSVAKPSSSKKMQTVTGELLPAGNVKYFCNDRARCWTHQITNWTYQMTKYVIQCPL